MRILKNGYNMLENFGNIRNILGVLKAIRFIWHSNWLFQIVIKITGEKDAFCKFRG